MIKYLREPINGFTHFIGFILSVVGLCALINISIHPVLRTYHLVSFIVFGFGLILMYAASTLYHWLKLSVRGIANMRKVDHLMIFITIAATYTPICVIPLKGTLGWVMLTIIWCIAVAGIFFSVFWITAPRWLSTSIYIFMGWTAVLISYPLFQALPAGALWWLFAGGLFYTLGAVIYAVKKPNFIDGWFGFHEIFHVFVILGSYSHFRVMYAFLAHM